jgi:hypothetical protein
MRSRSARPITSLLGSLGLHGCALLVFFLAAQRPALPEPTPTTQPDAWSGTNTVEVDAITTPDPLPNINNTESPNPPTPAPAPASTPAPAPHQPKPRPKPASPNAESAAAAPPETNGSHAQTSAATSGSFGSEGLPPGVRSLPSAFTRAIPPATGADPIWQSLPVGTQEPFILAMQVDAEGHIGTAKILLSHDEGDIPPQFEHIRQRVTALLGGGLFALKNGSSSGTDLFRITITLSDRAVQQESASGELLERGFDPPIGKTPGRAYFTLASGRHFEARVEVIGQPARPVHP